MDWKPPRRSRPRDQWGQFRSQADIRAEQQQARFASLQVAVEEQYWLTEEEAQYDDEDEFLD